MGNAELVLFALNASHDYGERVARSLGQPLERHEEREFEDGEHKARPLANLRNKDAFESAQVPVSGDLPTIWIRPENGVLSPVRRPEHSAKHA